MSHRNIKIKFKIKKTKYIDLFCGIGGTKCVLSCDIDKFCRENYHLNYGIEPHPNVKNINPENIEDFDIICGGFPCQAFSNAGKKKHLTMIEVYYLTKL